MPTFINIRAPLARNSNANPLDVIKIKSGLSSLGHYESPDWGISKFPDSALFQAVRDFQKSQGLKVDGVMKPEGETLAALQTKLRGAKERTATQAAAKALQGLGRNGDKVLAHLTQGEAKLLHDITDGASINPQTGLLEFWQDYEAEAAGIGGQNNGPDKPSKPDKDNGGSNGGNSDDKFGNDQITMGPEEKKKIAEDYTKKLNSLSGWEKFVLGSKYGHQNWSKVVKEMRDKAANDKSVLTKLSHPTALFSPDTLTPDLKPVTPSATPNITSTVPMTVPSMMLTVAPANQTGAQTNTKAQDLKAELAQAEAAAW